MADGLFGEQVEARLRQIEGKVLASGSAAVGQPQNQKAYDPKAQGATAAQHTDSKAYNPAADIALNGPTKKEKKEKVILESMISPFSLDSLSLVLHIQILHSSRRFSLAFSLPQCDVGAQ